MENAFGLPQRVVVLGGDSDIGIATCKKLITRGASDFVLAGRNLEHLEDRSQELRERGASIVDVVPFDAIDFDSHQGFADLIFASPDDVDLVLVTFGLLGDQEHDEADAQSAVRVAQVNYTGAMSVLIPISQHLQRQGHGAIVVLSSVAAERARRSNFIYGSAKAGLDWFAQGLGDALQGSGVHVMIVRPGFARSKMTAHMKTPPLATDPELVATEIVAGLKDQSEIVWVPGKLRWVMTVIRHLPRPIFRKLKF